MGIPYAFHIHHIFPHELFIDPDIATWLHDYGSQLDLPDEAEEATS